MTQKPLLERLHVILLLAGFLLTAGFSGGMYLSSGAKQKDVDSLKTRQSVTETKVNDIGSDIKDINRHMENIENILMHH